MIEILKSGQKCHLEEGEAFFSIIPEDRIWNNGCKLQEDGFRAIQQWNLLPGRWWLELSVDGYLSRASSHGDFNLDSCTEKGTEFNILKVIFHLYDSVSGENLYTLTLLDS